MKRFFAMFLAMFLLLQSATFPAFADSSDHVTNRDTTEELVWHDISDLEHLSISETYTYDELHDLFIANGFTEEETIKYIGGRPLTRSTSIRYTLLSMNLFKYPLEDGIYSAQARFTAGLEYIGSSTSPHRIVSLKGAHVYTGARSACSFSGTLDYTLVAGNEIYYSMYGDLYKRGTMNWSASIEIGIKGAASMTCTLSNGDGYLKNISESETYHAGGLEP